MKAAWLLIAALVALNVFWSCSADHTYRPKPVDAGPDDAAAADTGPELDGWWTAEPDRCGPDEVRSGMERYVPPAPPAVLGETPRLLWTTNLICNGVVSDKIRGHAAYGPLTIDGVTEPRLAVVAYDYRGRVIEAYPELIGTLDPHTGQELHCFDLLSHETTTSPFLLLDPEAGRFFFAFETDFSQGVSAFISGPQPPPTFTPVPFRHFDTSISVSSTWTLSQQGQALLAAGNRIVVSYDAITGQRLWAKDPLTDWDIPFINAKTTGVWTAVSHAAPDELLVNVTAEQRINGLSESGLFKLDVCGQVEPLYNGLEATNVVRLSNGDHVGLVFDADAESHALAHWKDWKIIHTVDGCSTYAVLSDDRVACIMRTTSSQRVPQIQIHDFVNEPVTIPLGPPVTDVARWVVAGAGDVLIAGGSYREEQGTGHLVLLFARPPYDTVDSFELQLAPGANGWFDGPPLIAPDGILYVDLANFIYAVQTDIFGLTRSVYPRSGRGGNANRGHVVLDP